MDVTTPFALLVFFIYPPQHLFVGRNLEVTFMQFCMFLKVNSQEVRTVKMLLILLLFKLRVPVFVFWELALMSKLLHSSHV